MVINIIKKLGEFVILGYTDLINKRLIMGLEFLGNDEVLTDIIKNHKSRNEQT